MEELSNLIKDFTISGKCRLRMEHKEVLSYSQHTVGMIAKLSKMPISKVRLLSGIDFDEWDGFLHPESYCRWVDEQFGKSFGDSARVWEKKRISRKTGKSEKSIAKNA